jgi:cyclohexyl-isocyanide hydratase
MTRSRWLFHVTDDRTRAIVAGPEGFVHCSFLPDVEETIRAHFEGRAGLHVVSIDPRRVGARIGIAKTPRGPMPHVFGPIPSEAVGDVRQDAIRGTKFCFVAFRGMTLLDLVGMHDPISRIAKMGFDTTTTCEIVAAHEGDLWEEDGARYTTTRVRPPLDEFDVLVVPGGPGTRGLESDAAVIDWLRTFPENRLAVSVCTGSLLLGAAGRLRGKRATTHWSAIDQLAKHGAAAVSERVVDEGDIITGGGVTSALDVGVHVVREIAGDDVAAKIARQMELR